MKRLRTLIIWIVVLCAVVFFANGKSFDLSQQHVEPQIEKYAVQARSALQRIGIVYPQTTTKTTTKKEQTDSSQQTPIESIVPEGKLNNTYYYHFKSGTPDKAKQVFEQAIQEYNDTGIVKLVAGKGDDSDNTITLSVYDKQESNLQQNSIELGNGGPKIIEGTNLSGQYVLNHASGRLNAYYPRSYNVSVAIHELGHCLGLDHSTETTSVMYPYDQGVSQLSTQDLAGLRAIYSEN